MFSNECTKVGDLILTVKSIYPEWSGDAGLQNDGGIGTKNRTHDAHADDCTVYKVNRIRKVNIYQDKFQRFSKNKGIVQMYEDEFIKMSMLRRSKYIFIDVFNVEYYISVSKKWSASKKSRANLRVNSDEFWNLTFLNSTALSQLLLQPDDVVLQLGNVEMKSAEASKYISTALEIVKEREAQASDWLSVISPEILQDQFWRVKLSEWMLASNVHKLSAYRMKQFANSLKVNKKR